MRSFFQFASCCCGPACRSAVITTAVKPAAEERFVPLYAASVPVNSRRKQSRRLASRSGSSGEWRPALNAISEDIVVVEREAAGGSETITRKRKVTQSSRKVQVRNYVNDDYRRAPFGGAMVPAFSPTPFFF